VVGGWWLVASWSRGSGRWIFFVQHFSIFPRFLDGGWAWVSPTVEGIFLMFAKLGEVRGKLFTQQKLKTPRFFELGMFRMG
jgi:hypothetical protein